LSVYCLFVCLFIVWEGTYTTNHASYKLLVNITNNYVDSIHTDLQVSENKRQKRNTFTKILFQFSLSANLLTWHALCICVTISKKETDKLG